MPKPKIIKEIPKKVLVRRRIKTRSELEEEIVHADTLNLKDVMKKREEEEIEKKEKDKKDKNLEAQIREVPQEQPIEKRKEKEELPPVLAYKAAQEQKQEYRIMGSQQENPQQHQATYTTASSSESEQHLSSRNYERPHEREKESKRDKPLRYRTHRDED